MLKYTNTEVVFDEVPDEITLAVNISNCPIHCPGCHSRYLWDDVGDKLDIEAIESLISKNKGITCISLMGGDLTPDLINSLAKNIREEFPNLKISWYSGKDQVSDKIELENFDFIKLGPFIQEFGGLDKKTTNQRFYKVFENELIDITNLFWKNDRD